VKTEDTPKSNNPTALKAPIGFYCFKCWVDIYERNLGVENARVTSFSENIDNLDEATLLFAREQRHEGEGITDPAITMINELEDRDLLETVTISRGMPNKKELQRPIEPLREIARSNTHM